MSELIPAAIAGDIESGRRASNLAFALFILPADRRADALTFYRFCRVLDDIADSPALSSDEKGAAFDAWASALARPETLPEDLRDVVKRRSIDPALLAEILAGVRMDLSRNRYQTFAEAREYCWRVASAVGLVSIRIFGCTDRASETYAETLGLALQWTNILRDVGEDAANHRIYLPLDEIARFGLTEDDILARRDSPAFRRLMEFQATRARGFYAELRVPPADRDALRPAEIMRAIYAKLLLSIESDGYRVFERRHRISKVGKLFLAARCLLRG